MLAFPGYAIFTTQAGDVNLKRTNLHVRSIVKPKLPRRLRLLVRRKTTETGS